MKSAIGNFLLAWRFRDLADLNAQMREQVLQVAEQRVHGATPVRPLENF